MFMRRMNNRLYRCHGKYDPVFFIRLFYGSVSCRVLNRINTAQLILLMSLTISRLMIFHALFPGYLSAQPSSFPPDIQRIMDCGKLVVAMYYLDIPPFFMHTADKDVPSRHTGISSPFIRGEYFYGIDVKIALDMAKELGVACEFHRTSKDFNEIVETVVSHKADVAITLLSRTLDRSRTVLFTQPYIILHHGLLLNRLALTRYEKGTSLKDFINTTDMKIGVKGGIAWPQFLKHYFPKAGVVEYPAWEDVISSVRSGTVMAAYADELEIKKLTVSKPEVVIELKTLIIEDIQDPIAMAVSWDSPNLLQWINTYLNQEHIFMTVDDILEKYFESVTGEASRELTEQGEKNE